MTCTEIQPTPAGTPFPPPALTLVPTGFDLTPVGFDLTPTDDVGGTGEVAGFDARPLLPLLRQRLRQDSNGLPDVARRIGIPLRTLRRVLTGGRLSPTLADRCAVALGYHPCQIWPDWFPPEVANDTTRLDPGCSSTPARDLPPCA